MQIPTPTSQYSCRHTGAILETLQPMPTLTPTHSPYHPKHKLTTCDEADVLTLSRGYPRDLSLTILQLTRTYNLEHPSAPITPLQLIHKLTHTNTSNKSQRTQRTFTHLEALNHVSTPMTPLNVLCLTCAGTYRIIRTDPTLHCSPPTHCIYCGATTITVTQTDTEEAAWHTLAEHYDLTVQIIKALYARWNQTSTLQNFGDYMQLPAVQDILPTLRKVN